MSYKITDNCVGCTLCAQKCPYDAISGELKQQHTIDSVMCSDCGVCGRICPSSAVNDENGNVCERVHKTKLKKPNIISAKCSACSLCVDICGVDCIAISKPQYIGDYHVHAELVAGDKCVSCYKCAEICPLKAIDLIEVM